MQRHGTLVANTVTTVTLDNDYREIEVINVDGASTIYVTVDGTVPTVGGNDTFVLPAAISSRVIVSRDGSNPTVVKLISTGTPSFSVSVD
jgi:hypothetical protein